MAAPSYSRGDSVTHRGPYSQYIEPFFVTRYPERRIRFMNSGISGDKAADALTRFEEDVAAFDPDYVSVMLGMNDGGYKDFSQEKFAKYRIDMNDLLARIEKNRRRTNRYIPQPFRPSSVPPPMSGPGIPSHSYTSVRSLQRHPGLIGCLEPRKRHGGDVGLRKFLGTAQ